MLLNTQPAEKRDVDATGLLQVHSIFPTVQGEGPFSGRPCVFVRLAGCNITCPGCDTIYTGTREVLTVEQILARVQEFDPKHKMGFVVITGGEPFRQNITPLCAKLGKADFHVQIETNGTLPPSPDFGELFFDVTVVCSPKGTRVAEELQTFITAYKYVLDDQDADPSDGLPMTVLGAKRRPARPHASFGGEIFVSPMDVQDFTRNHANRRYVVQQCMMFGYVVNLQLHKLLNLP